MAKVLSIEVGHSFTRICEMDFRVKAPRIYKYINLPTPQGMVEDGFLADNVEFTASVKKALMENKIKTKQAVFTITSSKIATREVMLPAIKTNRMDALVKANASDYFPIDLTEYEIAHLILEAIKGEDGKVDKYKVLVMAAGKNLINGYERFAEQCGLHLISLDYTGNSIYQIMKNECKEETEMVIKVEERSTTAMVISNQMLMLQRTIVYGVDDAIQTVMRNPAFEEKSYRDSLDLMKRKTCMSLFINEETTLLEREDEVEDSERIRAAKREIAMSMTPLVGNVSKVLDLYNSKNPNTPIRKISLVGLGSDISGLSKLLTNELGIKTYVMTDLSSISWNRNGGEGNPGRYIANIGATISPVGFINEEKKKSDLQNMNYRNVSILLGLFFAVFAGTLTISALMRYKEVDSERQRLAALEAKYAPAEGTYKQYQNLQTFYKEIEIGYRMTELPNDNLLNFLTELEQKLPSDTIMKEITSDDKEATLTMKVTNKEKAAKVIQTLRGFDSVMDVSIGALDKEETEEEKNNDEKGVLFSIVCTYYTYTPTVPEASVTSTPAEGQ